MHCREKSAHKYFERDVLVAGANPNSRLLLYGPTKEPAEKVSTGSKINSPGAKAQRILNQLRPD
jgi:hypothetical protein